ncbi:hypothetical protein HNV11_03650 [Spirosoma taeanense]|uniref:DUF3108 domain-containing protein n=1 Tax=Spirosoma taeanense TaxID=2735870 RepID=A0A6M5Y5P8_9BACT|nr:DUF6134 family protein [Spirosoma taeanense]QJW88531.1 hypothetical protein HNV11_03650 [Spirosoma taeanense]
MLLIQLTGICLLNLFFCAPSAQPLTYDVVVNNANVGQLRVNSTTTATGVQYQVDGSVTMNLLGEKRMITQFTSIYRGSLMTEASSVEQLNGRTRHNSSVNWDGNSYHIRINDARSRLTDRRVTYSTARLYYHEPYQIRELFSERHGQFCHLRPVGAHTYELTMPDGRKNYYRYVDGVCREVEVNQPFFTCYFRLHT